MSHVLDQSGLEGAKVPSASVRQAFEAYAERQRPEVREAAREMLDIVESPETDDDEKFAAMTTLFDMLHFRPNPKDGMLGMELKQSESFGAEHSDDTLTVLAKMDSEEAQFARRLESVMSDKNVTQTELAARIGIGQPAISMMLQRNCRPQRKTVQRIAEALGVSPEDLWAGFRQ